MSRTAIQGSVVFVTGANRGIGCAITEALLARGAEKVYAATRKPEALADLSASYGQRLVPIELDVTDAGQVRSAAEKAIDVRILVNNAGVANAILDGLEAGVGDIYPDAFAAGFGQQFQVSPKASEEQLAAMFAQA